MPLYKPMENTRTLLSVLAIMGSSWHLLACTAAILAEVLFSLSLSLVLRFWNYAFMSFVIGFFHGMFKISTSFKGNKWILIKCIASTPSPKNASDFLTSSWWWRLHSGCRVVPKCPTWAIDQWSKRIGPDLPTCGRCMLNKKRDLSALRIAAFSKNPGYGLVLSGEKKLSDMGMLTSNP